MNLFIVDDSDIKVEKIKLVILEAIDPSNCEIYVAQNVADATVFLFKGIPLDLMILDLNLPVRNGEEVKSLSGLNVIKEINRRPNITRPKSIIGLTAHLPLKDEAIKFFRNEGWALVSFDLQYYDWEETIKNKISYYNVEAAPQPKRKILFISSSPKDHSGLSIGTEQRKIEESIRLSTLRDEFEFVAVNGCMFSLLSRHLLIHHPEFLHLSGHGDGEGIVLENEEGVSEYISIQILESLFDSFKDTTKCIILSSCYSADKPTYYLKKVPMSLAWDVRSPKNMLKISDKVFTKQ